MLNSKSQIPISKQTPNSKLQTPKLISLVHWLFGHWLLFVICVLCIVISADIYALDLDKIKVYFLNGDYKSAISEGERIMGSTTGASSGLDQLYYILGLSYLKDGNYLRASDIFEIILRELKESKFKEEAYLGLGDAYFLKGDFGQAEQYYQELLNRNPQTKFKAQTYYRLSQTAFKKGDSEKGRAYLDKIKKDFALNNELRLDKDLSSLADLPLDFYYTVQVGSFSNLANASNLKDKLIKNGYAAFIEEVNIDSKKIFRVKAGKLKTRSEAVQLEKELSCAGYPTKIFP
jgi:tetratricopeptide (TPR) repeat protein